MCLLSKKLLQVSRCDMCVCFFFGFKDKSMNSHIERTLHLLGSKKVYPEISALSLYAKSCEGSPVTCISAISGFRWFQ